LRDPDWNVLTGKDIHCDIELSLLMKRVDDPAGDDVGDGIYEYPTDENFRDGILDLRQFEVRDAKDSYYFSLTFDSLWQPGWHPEYGFQLTYGAICLHTNSSTRTDVGSNSNLQLATPFDRIIYVGGGLRIEDGAGKILGEFIPRTMADEFGGRGYQNDFFLSA
jgi:carbohydrate-binding DOMON domain-containing protein